MVGVPFVSIDMRDLKGLNLIRSSGDTSRPNNRELCAEGGKGPWRTSITNYWFLLSKKSWVPVSKI